MFCAASPDLLHGWRSFAAGWQKISSRSQGCENETREVEQKEDQTTFAVEEDPGSCLSLLLISAEPSFIQQI